MKEGQLDDMNDTFDLPRLLAALVGLEPEKANAEIQAWVDEHKPTREHFAKVVTV